MPCQSPGKNSLKSCKFFIVLHGKQQNMFGVVKTPRKFIVSRFSKMLSALSVLMKVRAYGSKAVLTTNLRGVSTKQKS